MKSSKNDGTDGLWGELPERETHKQEIVPPDIIENIWRQVTEECNSTDEYQLSEEPEFIELPQGNPHVLNTINLLVQLRAMEDGTILKGISEIDIGPSQQEESQQETLDFSVPKTKSRKEFKGNGCIPSLQPVVAHNVLKHAVTLLLAHVGFETSTDIAIETLTDVAAHFLRRISLLLKSTSENPDHGFPDAMEKVLLEAGTGGIAAIHNYYEENILKYEINVRRKVEKKLEQQRQMEQTVNNTKVELEEASNRLQFDELGEFSNVYRDVPTLQLLDPDMGFPPSLDAGFQMLHSLEQDELNSLEVEEEEVNVSDSPSTSHQHINFITDKKKK